MDEEVLDGTADCFKSDLSCGCSELFKRSGATLVVSVEDLEFTFSESRLKVSELVLVR